MATLGIDFGSTYSMFSSYNGDHDKVKGIQTENGSVYIPSVACVDEFGDLQTGQDAREAMLSDPTLPPYRAFKMLLHETDPAKYREYGYIDDTPGNISKQFLRKYVDIAVQNCGVQQFEKAVICVPEHWTHDCSRMGGRATLLDICRGFEHNGQPILKNIRVVAEPVAAAAFYAYNYWKCHNMQPFQGRVIVVDYGGGTLDVTLTTVTARSEGGSSSTMEIDINYGTGGGQNHPGRIGDAGLAYMERVSSIALAAAGFPDAPIDASFLKVKDKLETELMRSTLALDNRISSKYYRGLKQMAEDHEIFTYAAYKRKRVNITYAMLYQAFQELIRPMLEKYLDELREPLAKLGSSLDREDTDVKVAIVGGFGQFPLVQKAVWEILKCSDTALDITLDAAEGGRQDAISFGAALIAAGKITVPIRSSYSIGLRKFRGGEETFSFALRHGQEVDCSKAYPLDGIWEPTIYTESNDPKLMPWIFAISDNDDLTHAVRMTPRMEVIRELQEDMRNGASLFKAQMRKKGIKDVPSHYYFGFSMDESEIYTLKIFPRDPVTKERIKEPIVSKSIGNFSALFGSLVSFQPEQKDILTYIK